MKRKILPLTIFLVTAFVVALAIQNSIQAQRPSRGDMTGQPAGMPMMMPMFSVSDSWAFVSFELDLPDETLLKLRKSYKEAYDKSNKLRDQLQEARGDTEKMRALRADSDKIKSDLEAKLGTVLSKEQMEKLAEWEKESRDRMRRGFERPSSGGGRQSSGGRQ